MFINEDGTETTETLTSDYLGFVEKFFGSDLNQNSITHIYNSNNVNIIANLGWEWEHNKGVDCLNQAPGLLEAHGISSLCDAYRTYLIINNFITESNLFLKIIPVRIVKMPLKIFINCIVLKIIWPLLQSVTILLSFRKII